jgi:PAS domain S-box-containing protein
LLSLNSIQEIEEGVTMEFKRGKFKQIRIQKRWAITTLAEKCGISRSSISRWETGKLEPSEKMIRKMARFLQIAVSEISSLVDEQPKSHSLISGVAESYLSFTEDHTDFYDRSINTLHKTVHSLNNKIKETAIITKALLSSMDICFYIKDINSKYVIANKKLLKILSLPVDYNILGKTDGDIFSYKEAKNNFEEDIDVLRTGESILKQEAYIPGTRKKKWGMVSKIPILDINGSTSGIIGTFVDITDRKKEEERRKILEESVKNIEDGVLIWKNPDKRIDRVKTIFINNGIQKITGMSLEIAFVFKNWLNIVHWDDQELFEKALFIADSSKTAIYKFRIIDKVNDQERIIRVKVFQYEKDSYIGLFRDITEEVRENEIKEMLEQALYSTKDVVWYSRLEPTYKILYISQSVSELFGYPPEVFYNDKDFWYKNCCHPDDVEELLNYRDDMRWPSKKEHRIIRKDGQVRWIETSVTPKKVRGKQCVFYIDRDITERKEAEKDRELLEELMKDSPYIFWVCESAPKSKTIFVSDSVKDIYGYETSDFINKYDFWINNCVHEDDIEKCRNAFFYNNDEINKLRCRIVRPDGTIRHVETTIINKKENYIAYVEKDVTDEIREAEEAEFTKTLDIARCFLKKGIDIDTVSNCTGLHKNIISEKSY